MNSPKTTTKKFNGDRYNDALLKVETASKPEAETATNALEKDASYIELGTAESPDGKFKAHRVYIKRDQIIYESNRNPEKPTVFISINRPETSPVQGFWIERKWVQRFDGYSRDVILSCSTDEFKRPVYELSLHNNGRTWHIIADLPTRDIVKTMVYRGVATDACGHPDKWETWTEYKARTKNEK